MSSPNRNDWKPEAAPFVPGAAAATPNLTPAVTEFHPGYIARQQSDPTTSSTGLAPTAQEFRPNTAYPSQAYANGGMPSYQVEPASYATDAEVFNAAEQIIEAPKLIPRSCRPLPDKRTFGNSKMLPDDVRSYYAHQAKLILEELAPDNPRLREVPREFHSVLPLDNPNKKAGKAGSSGYPTSLYKVVSSNDGYVYCLRRVDNVRRGLHGLCAKAAQEWAGVHHPSIVPLRNAFERRGALFFQYDYFPGAQNLHDYITARGNGNLLPEKVIWSMSLQILSAIRFVHANHMACRCINPSSIIVCGRLRVRLSGVGLIDVLERDGTMSLAEHQQEDLANMGRIVLVLACMSMQAVQDVGSTVEFVRSAHSPELAGMVTALLTRPCTLQRVLAQCGTQLAQCMDTTLQHADALEEHLASQFESERLSRLLIKLGMVNERPEYGSSWSETGDRYLLKLFRDYVFHQTDDAGKPWLDLGHILDSLNKLDIGANEKILLTSRDERSVLVVTFADVRKCLEHTFQEIVPSHLRNTMKHGMYYM